MSTRAPKVMEETPVRWADNLARVVEAALAAREAEERERKSQRVKAAKERNRRSGRHQGGRRRFGYRLEPALDGGAPVEIPDPAEQRAMTEMLELRQRGVSLMAVRDQMRDRGFQISHEYVRNLEARATGKALKPKNPSLPVTRTRSVLESFENRKIQVVEKVAAIPAASTDRATTATATPVELQQALSEIRADLARLTEQRSTEHQTRRNERESVQPILRRLTEIERHLRLTESPVAPRTSRRHPLGA
jgi:hypothetical protein